MEYLPQAIIDGLTIGSGYVLVALGFGLIFSVSGVLNVAHAEIYMLGAFGSALAISALGGGIALALAVGTLVGAVSGWILQLSVLRRLKTDQPLAAFIATIGIGSAITFGVARIAGIDPRGYPALLDPLSRQIGSVRISDSQLFLWGATALLLVGIQLWVGRSQSGREMRAVAESEQVAVTLGIRVSRVKMITIVVASALAGITGPLLGQLYGTYQPFMGGPIALGMFVVVLVAGTGSIGGIAVVGVGLGMIESFTVFFLGSQYQAAAGFLVLIAVVLLRPQGLFGRAVRAG